MTAPTNVKTPILVRSGISANSNARIGAGASVPVMSRPAPMVVIEDEA